MPYRQLLLARWTSQRGSAIVELTLLVPLFLLMLLGTADFARVFYTALSVSQAARAGVQYGAQDNEKSKRSEEHTSELQSRGHLVCRLLLEKKKIRPYQFLQPRIA